MTPITLNDGTFLYDEDILEDYLKNLGFNVRELTNALCPEVEEINLGEWVRRDDVDKYEEWYSDLSVEVRTGYDTICELCDKLASGKGGTKVQYADKIRRAYFENFEDL